MLKYIVTTGLIVNASFQKSLNTLVTKIKNIDIVGPFSQCNQCYIDMCSTYMNIPNIESCQEINTMLDDVRKSIVSKSTDTCIENSKKYSCEVFFKPTKDVYDSSCDNGHLLLQRSLKNSFCSSNTYCENISQCFDYPLDCDDHEILPYINSFNSMSQYQFSYDTCTDSDDTKSFFDNNWKIIIFMLCFIIISLMITIIICFLSRRFHRQEIIIEESEGHV